MRRRFLLSKEAFIKKISGYAQKAGDANKILPSLIIAQAALESAWGTSVLAVRDSNLFGIKGAYRGQSDQLTTSEYDAKNGWRKIVAPFRKYPNIYASVLDLVALYQLPRYRTVIGEMDYKKAAQAIQDAGFATDANYAAKLITTIQVNDLQRFDGKKVNTVKKTVKQVTSRLAIVPYPGRVLSIGSTGKDVQRIQNAVGIQADGIYGPQTAAAVRAYQRRHRLDVDGQVGPVTWAIMF
ncbi:glucosaminidase domain-containing protein [Sporolactobacillus spathodeae]|uniref:glucosaminidase domain-containing protein n=1 Tax=Sporolactobacillus spathodeae TaxID=1465502 RepID=UPI0030B85605